MAVSKTHPVSCLLEAAQAGQTVFGENRVQEFSGKRDALYASGYSLDLQPAIPSPDHPPPLHVHLIGHLQSNKASRAAGIFTSIDTLDSLRLAERLNDAAARAGRLLPVLLEIKLSHEPSKEGLDPESAELRVLLERLPDLSALRLDGLMTVAPLDENEEIVRACFGRLRQLRDTLARRYSQLAFPVLSMGMSGDYAIAIEEGSTQVRLGTAIFGPRPRPV